MSSLYILGIRPLSEVSLSNEFSHTVGSLFSASSPIFVCGFVYVGHSDWCEMVPHCGFNLQRERDFKLGIKRKESRGVTGE